MFIKDRLGKDVFFSIIFLILAIIISLYLSYQDFDFSQMQGAVSTSSSSKYLAVNIKGEGAISTSPTGTNCKLTSKLKKCYFPKGTTVTVTAIPKSGSVFAGWTGVCNHKHVNCIVTLNTSVSINAVFDSMVASRSVYNIAVSKTGAGSGTITSNLNWVGIDCGGKCWGEVTSEMGNLILYAKAKTGSKFIRWSGDCTGTKTSCSLGTVKDNKNIIAEFCLNECSNEKSFKCTGTNTYQYCKYDENYKCLILNGINQECGSGKGQTNCGYSTCNRYQKPQWYCSNNSCKFTCYTAPECK